MGFLFWLHGLQKLFGMFGFDEPVELMSRIGAVAVIETVGGPLIILGLFTRPVAFILAGEMAGAYFTAHMPKGLWAIMNGGERAVCSIAGSTCSSQRTERAHSVSTDFGHDGDHGKPARRGDQARRRLAVFVVCGLEARGDLRSRPPFDLAAFQHVDDLPVLHQSHGR